MTAAEQAPQPTRTFAEMALDARSKNLECSIVSATFQSTGADGNSKTIRIMTGVDAKGDQVVVLLGDRPRRGPTLFVVGDAGDVVKFTRRARVAFNASGYPQPMKYAHSYTSAASLYSQVFEQHGEHVGILEAYLRLIGYDMGSPFEDVMTRAGAQVEDKPVKKTAAQIYADNPLYGIL